MLFIYQFVTICFLLLSGCTYFAPKYKTPSVKTPDNWQFGNRNKPTNLPILYWWKSFNNNQLNKAIDLALQYNTSVLLAKNNIEQAQAQLDTVALNWVPGVNFLSGLMNSNSSLSLDGFTLPAANSTVGFIGFIPQYTLNIFNNITRYRQAKYLLEMAKADFKSVRLTVIGKVVTAYFISVAAKDKLVLLNEARNDMLQLYATKKAAVDQGFGSQIAVNGLWAKINDLQGQISLCQQNLIHAKNALRYLLGETPGGYVINITLSAFNPNQIIPGNLPASVIAERPDLIAAESKLKAANEGIAINSSLLMPTLNVSAFFAKIHTLGSGDQISSTINSKSLYASSILSPTIFGTIHQSKKAYNHAEIVYIDMINNVLHEVDNALESHHSLIEKYQYNVTAQQAATGNLKISKALYRKGLISFNTYLDSKIQNTFARLMVLQSRLDALISDIAVYQALGGGYNYHAEESHTAKKDKIDVQKAKK